MPVPLLSIGYLQELIQNEIYSLPSSQCLLFCDTAGVTLFQSNTFAFTVSVALTLVDGMSKVAGGFIRCTSAGPVLVMLKKS